MVQVVGTPVIGNDNTPSSFNPNRPYGVWGDSGTVSLGGGGNGVVGSSAAYTAIAGFSQANDPRAAGVFGTGTWVGIAGAVQGATTFPQGKVGVYGTSSRGRDADDGTGVEGRGKIGVAGFGSRGGDGVRGSNDILEGSAATFLKGADRPGTLAAVQIRNSMRRGEAAWLEVKNALNRDPVMKLLLSSSSGSNFLECHRPDSSRKCHINKNGTFVSGSDFAESLPVRGPAEYYEPGDVLVLAKDGSGVEKASEPISRRIIGVYSSRPGILGADKDGDTFVDVNDIPVAVLGIVPTKVTDENGTIAIGDLLVTASTPAHAMKAKPMTIGDVEIFPTGAILGKALEPLQSSAGVIKVLVMLR
jgi:hypothetical protein